jgi:phage terminase large subunit-like protein
MAKPKTFVGRANAYARDVVRGKIPACRLTILACKRHLDDLQKAKSKDYRWRFNKKRAELWCESAENFTHVKGVLKGEYIELMDFHIFILCALGGWESKLDGARRFLEAYIAVARKNAKSTLAAIIGHILTWIDAEPGAESYCGATSEKQALEVFRPAWLMAKADPEFRSHFGISLSGTLRKPTNMHCLETAAIFEPVIGKPGDGASPSFGGVDEFHEHKTADLYDTFDTGMGNRVSPLLLITTTTGVDTSVPCFDKHKEAEAVLNGAVEDDRFFTIIFSIDDDDKWENFDCWAKANPGMGVSVREDYLRKQHAKAMRNAAAQNIILTKHLNLWRNAGVGAFNMAAWNEKCVAQDLSIEEFIGRPCWLGMDLANRVDVASLVAVFEHEGGYACFDWHYLPRETVELPQNKRYRIWEDHGHLRVTDGARTDFGAIKDQIIELNAKFNVVELAYDPKEATLFVDLLQQQPEISFVCIEVTQSSAYMSEPMKELEADVLSGGIKHGGTPIMTWMMSNVVKKQARGGGPVKYYYPTKEKEEFKIDGAVALIMARMRAMANEDRTSVYEDENKVIEVI